MKLSHLLLVLTFLFGGVFLTSSVAEAQTCAQKGGNCMSQGICDQAQKSNPNVTCLSTEDCLSSDQNACAVNTSKQAGDNCLGAGGSCAEVCTDNQESIGVLGCPASFDGTPKTCCKVPTAVAPAAADPKAAGGAQGAAGVSATTGIDLPVCIQSGNCSLDDIVQTGVNFALFLFGLSAALFFLVFIYGGAMYLLSFGNSGMVDKGKKAITGAVIGFLLVMSAWSIVKLVDESLRQSTAPPTASGTKPTCDQKVDQGYSCQTLSGKTEQEALLDAKKKNLSCQTGLCPLPANILCCKSK